MRYGRVARVYEVLERMAFGGRLMDVRLSLLEDFVAELGEDGRVLLVGGGDGRFLKELVETSDGVRVDYVDLSEGMMEVARQRVGDFGGRVRYFVSDVREWEEDGYDAVIAHFCLDCFEGEELMRVVDLLSDKVVGGGVMLVSDFNPAVGWWARALVWVMGVFFWVFARAKVIDIVRADCLIERIGWSGCSRFEIWKGFVYSVMFKKHNS